MNSLLDCGCAGDFYLYQKDVTDIDDVVNYSFSSFHLSFSGNLLQRRKGGSCATVAGSSSLRTGVASYLRNMSTAW